MLKLRLYTVFCGRIFKTTARGTPPTKILLTSFVQSQSLALFLTRTAPSDQMVPGGPSGCDRPEDPSPT